MGHRLERTPELASDPIATKHDGDGAQATDVPEATVWRFQMYGGITFGGDTKRPGPASLAVAVTGKDSAIRNLRFKGAVAHRDSKKIGRNEPCPCGSGKKYKRCHGGIQRESVSVAATNVAPSVYQPLAAHGYGPHQFGNELRGR
ncbi:MAG: SEC-C metal-binding domain-containing protein [Candidatus Sulfotelmatobacter sp.]